MKAVLISIQPKWCEKIASGEKTIEVRKSRPKIETPFKCYIYEIASKYRKGTGIFSETVSGRYELVQPGAMGRGKVIGEFVCDKIDKYTSEFYIKEDVYQELRKVWMDEYCDYPEEDYEIIITNERENPNDCELLRKACLTFDEIKRYIGNGDKAFYAWHISDLKIYDQPKKISDFSYSANHDFTKGAIKFLQDMGFVCHGSYVTRAPQSWFYVEELE